MTVPFTKTQTVGNDFVLVDGLVVRGHDPSRLAVATADRRRSVGHDGLLVVTKESDHVSVRFFNPDGTEDFCGNGLRCAGKYAVDNGWFVGQFEMRQLGRVIPVTVVDGLVTTKMPAAEIQPAQVPVLHSHPLIEEKVEGIIGSAISTGSTHFVTFLDQLPQSPEFDEVSRRIEISPLFPERTSVMWTQVVGESELKTRIWERGVGETMGCGTGAIACAVIHSKMKGVVGPITVHSQGGSLVVTVDQWDRPVTVSSRPVTVFQGIVTVDY